MKQTIFTLLILALVVLVGCSQAPEEPGNNQENIVVADAPKLSVVTTLFPLYEFAQEVGGDAVEATLLLPPGAEPHAFDPKPSDIKKIEHADAFIYIGEIMEPWAHDILEGTTNTDLHVLDASSLVELLESDHHDEHDEHEDEEEHHEDEEHDEEHEDEHHDEEEHDEEHDEEEGHEEHEDEHEESEEDHDEDEHEEDEHDEEHEDEHDDHGHGAFDPHIWLDLENDQKIVMEIAEIFSALDPENAEAYAANANAYVAKLQALDEKYKNDLSNCAQDEFLVGGHNFFGYIEHRYDLTGISAIENLAPHTEPSPKRVQEIAEIAQEHEIKYILTEVLVSKQMAEALAAEAGAEVLTFHPAPNLPKEDFNNGVTFLAVMEGNLETLKTALECS